MSFVWIWEQTAIISLYNINWLVFITEMGCVYCAVRTGYLHTIQVNLTCDKWQQPFKAQWSLYVPPHSTILRSPHTAVFMCSVWISEQTAIISLYSINWLVCITEAVCFYCAVRTGYLYIILRSAHTAVFMCSVWISEQTAIISLYSINWLVCITEAVCVYCAVRTESMCIIDIYRQSPVVTICTTRFNIQQFYVLLTHCVMRFVWIWEQTAIISLCSIYWVVCITETVGVYCEVRTEPLNKIQVIIVFNRQCLVSGS